MKEGEKFAFPFFIGDYMTDEFIFKERDAKALSLVDTILGGDDNRIFTEGITTLQILLSDNNVTFYPRSFIRLKESLEKALDISYVRIYSDNGMWILEVAWDFNRSGPESDVKEAPLLYA